MTTTDPATDPSAVHIPETASSTDESLTAAADDLANAERARADAQALAARQRRARQTTRNLVYALVACLGIVALILIAVPRDDSSRLQPVDFRQVAAGSQSGAAMRLAVPDLGTDWVSNRADYTARATDGIDLWYIGLRTPSRHFISLTQAHGANPTWVADQLDRRKATGTRTIDGHEVTVYDQRSDRALDGRSNYALTLDASGSTLIFNGTAGEDEFDEIVTAAVRSLSAAS